MEILDLIFNLTIALVAIDVSVYAISASLLGSQLKRNVLFIQRRLKETEGEIKRIQETFPSSRQRLSDIDEELEEFKTEERHFQNMLFCLKVKGAVLYPCVLFILALFSIVIGSILQNHVNLIALVASIFIFLGSYRVYCTLRSIDFASTNIPLPTFDALFYVNSEKRLEIEPAKKQNILFEIGNEGYDIGELIEISIFFPPDFKVHKSREYEINVQPKDATSVHPLYTGVFYEVDHLHIGTSIKVEIVVTSPEESKTYKIPVYTSERKIATQEFELEIVVR